MKKQNQGHVIGEEKKLRNLIGVSLTGQSASFLPQVAQDPFLSLIPYIINTIENSLKASEQLKPDYQSSVQRTIWNG